MPPDAATDANGSIREASESLRRRVAADRVTPMVDGADAHPWSEAASGWAELWGGFAAPAWARLIDACGIVAGTRVLDVGCGSGEFLAELAALGAVATGVDPAPAMVALARRRGPAVQADAEHLPFADRSFDAVTAVNALQFAEDAGDALREFARVLRPGGRIGLAIWAEGCRNDIDVVERAVADAFEEEPLPENPLRSPGGLEAAIAAAGLTLRDAGTVAVPWRAPSADPLVRGILLGEDPATIAELRPVVIEAAGPFRREDGSYALRNEFRWAVASSD
jgi:SAM-dependent methyltransferase